MCKCGFLSESVAWVWGTRWGSGILCGEWVGPGGLIWTVLRGGYVPGLNACDGWWGMALRESGIPRVTPHELRHMAASLAVQSGANVKAAGRMVGHASAVMTLDVYADLFVDDLGVLAQCLDSAAWLHSV